MKVYFQIIYKITWCTTPTFTVMNRQTFSNWKTSQCTLINMDNGNEISLACHSSVFQCDLPKSRSLKSKYYNSIVDTTQSPSSDNHNIFITELLLLLLLLLLVLLRIEIFHAPTQHCIFSAVIIKRKWSENIGTNEMR